MNLGTLVTHTPSMITFVSWFARLGQGLIKCIGPEHELAEKYPVAGLDHTRHLLRCA